MKYITYIGSYTDADHADGVRIYESDAETGEFRPLGALNTFESPTFMALNRDCTRLYTVLGRPTFGPAGRNGGVAAFAVKDDKLEFINEIRTGWTIPCHISLDPSEKALVYAEYACGTAGFADIREDGSIDPAFAGVPGAVPGRRGHQGQLRRLGLTGGGLGVRLQWLQLRISKSERNTKGTFQISAARRPLGAV